MALVAAGIADNGVIMAPHLLHQIVDNEGNVVEDLPASCLDPRHLPEHALAVRKLMLGSPRTPSGPAYGLFPPYQFPPVAAKTGTAQINGTGLRHVQLALATAPAGPGQTRQSR